MTESREYFKRDRVTAGFYVAFSAWGWHIFGITPVLPVLAEELGVSLAVAGLHGSSGAIGTVISGLSSSALASKIGRANQTLLGLTSLSLGILMLTLAPALWMSLPAMLLASFGGNTTISGSQTALTAHHRLWAPNAISEANALTTFFGLISPLVIGISMRIGFGWRPALSLAYLFTVTAVILIRRSRKHIDAVDSNVTETGALRLKKAQPTTPVFWLSWGVFMCGAGLENSTVMFSGQFIQDGTTLGPGLATASISLFVLGMTIARFTMGRLSGHVPARVLHATCFIVTIVGWIVFWPTHTSAGTLAGLFVMGLGIGGFYPVGVSILLQMLPGRLDFTQGVAVLGIGLAVATVPFIFGTLSDHTSTSTAFTLIPALGVLALILLSAAAILDKRQRLRK